jgi:hypothetical protein
MNKLRNSWKRQLRKGAEMRGVRKLINLTNLAVAWIRIRIGIWSDSHHRSVLFILFMSLERRVLVGPWAQHTGGGVASSLGRYVFGSEISYNKAPPRLPGLAC